MFNVPFTIELLEKVRWNCQLGKHKHLEASRRGRFAHILLGAPAVLINVFVGSVLFAFLGDETGFPQWGKWGGAALTLVAAVLGAIQTFFNFEKQYMEQRAVGNEYLAIARECELILTMYFDNLLQLHEIPARLEVINTKYKEITKRSEALNVSVEDYNTALKIQNKKQDHENSLLELYKQRNLAESNLQSTT